MYQPWPDDHPITEIDALDLLLVDALRDIGIHSVGEARRRASRLTLPGMSRRHRALLERLLRGPRCGAYHPRGTGRNSVGWCWLDRDHAGQHQDQRSHRWIDPGVVPDDTPLEALAPTRRLLRSLRDAGLHTTGDVRAAAPIAGVDDRGIAELRALGLLPDACRAISPYDPDRPLVERRCVHPAAHPSDHLDLTGDRWSRAG